jgi:hypothetical protein
MLLILLPTGATTGRCENNGQPEEFAIADGLLCFRPADGNGEWERHRILTATEDGAVTEYHCASRPTLSLREQLGFCAAAIATAVALLQAAWDETAPVPFLWSLLADRTAGTEPQGAVLQLAKALARDQAHGVATPTVAEALRELAPGELFEALATIEA